MTADHSDHPAYFAPPDAANHSAHAAQPDADERYARAALSILTDPGDEALTWLLGSASPADVFALIISGGEDAGAMLAAQPGAEASESGPGHRSTATKPAGGAAHC